MSPASSILVKGALAPAGVRVVTLFRADWGRAAILAIVPTVLFWLLCFQRVHFTRNALPIHPLVRLLPAYGVRARLLDRDPEVRSWPRLASLS